MDEIERKPIFRRIVVKTAAMNALLSLRLAAVAATVFAFLIQVAAAEDLAALYNQAQELVRRQRYAAAIPLLEKCVAAQPANSKFHQWLGRALALQGVQNGISSSVLSIGKVKTELEKAISLDPNNLQARNDLAIFYRALPGIFGGSNAKAAEQVAIIRRSDPALAAQIEGDFLAGDKKYDAALASYNESARLNPSNPVIHARISLIHQEKKDWEKAFAALDRGLGIDPNHPFLLYQLGRTAALSGQQLERGEKCLHTYLAMPVREELENPSFSAAHYRLGCILEKKGNPAAARAEYETALSLDAKMKPAREALAKLKR
jgi:tetratricopeptide (TPR) repeat protein